jgi:hypothetical protein
MITGTGGEFIRWIGSQWMFLLINWLLGQWTLGNIILDFEIGLFH